MHPGSPAEAFHTGPSIRRRTQNAAAAWQQQEQLSLALAAVLPRPLRNFFDFHLRAIPVPQWAGRDLTISFDDQSRTLLLRLRLPNLSPATVMKTRELRSNQKHVPAKGTRLPQLGR